MSEVDATNPNALFAFGILDVQKIGTVVKVKVLHDWVKTFRKNTEETLHDDGGPWVVERTVHETWRIRTGRRYPFERAMEIAVKLHQDAPGAILRLRQIDTNQLVVL